MAYALPRETAPLAPRRPSKNIIALPTACQPPVENPPRRGRYPANVVRLSSRPRIYVGCLCELRTADNAGVLVRVVSIAGENDIYIETAGSGSIVCNDGSPCRAAVTRAAYLHRTVFGERHV